MIAVFVFGGLALSIGVQNANSQPADLLVKSTPENVIWGELFTSDYEPILQVQSGDVVTIETISHEGILPDQGDTVEFFTNAGIDEADILPNLQGQKPRCFSTALYYIILYLFALFMPIL